MSGGCDILRGRGTSCKDAIGGLLNVYFVNYDEPVDGAGTAVVKFDESQGRYLPLTEEITSPTIAPTPGNEPKAYKYELHLGNDLTQNINSSPENGTLYFEQLTNLTLKKLSQLDNVEIRNLAAGRPYIFVEDQMGNLMLAGRINGNDVTGGTAVTGNDFGDLNGYTLTFTGKERTLANFYDGAVAAFIVDFDVITAISEVVTGVSDGTPISGISLATVQCDSTELPTLGTGVGNLYYSSEDELVATVDSAGLVTLVGAGSTHIIATSVHSPQFSGTTEVTVTA